MPPFGPLEIALVSVIVAAGACLQGSVGFGLAMVAAPLLVLVDSAFVPAPLILNASLLTALILYRERASLELRPIRWAIVGNALGSALAALALRSLDARGFSLLFGGLVLVAVLVSASGWHIVLSRRNALLAGTASGFMGTTSSIGGPPVALLYQRQRGTMLRASLSAYFLTSTLFGLPALAWAGRLGAGEVRLALLLLPGLLAGFALSGITSRRLREGAVRPAVLVVSALCGAAVLIRALA